VVFQPHRYSRTRDLLDDFAEVLAGVDRLLITEVYAAGEDPILNADGRSICRAVRSRSQVEPVFVADIDSLADDLAAVLQNGDVVVTLGAGSIGAAALNLPTALRTLKAVEM
jgi:UDP-N-acetylmuramate--alanine ligase